jgi:hypothetical protein
VNLTIQFKKNKIFYRQLSHIFGTPAVHGNNVNCSACETGPSVLNHASCGGKASLRGRARYWVE